ncbi:MAG: thioredoxin domain-containing protein [Planctomycetota bacterium]
MLAVTPQQPAISAEQAAERKLKIPLLFDEGNALGRRLGLVWSFPDDLREVYLGFGVDLSDHDWKLPMPARYVIDRDGIVAAADIHPDYTTRPEPEETLEIVTSLVRNGGRAPSRG